MASIQKDNNQPDNGQEANDERPRSLPDGAQSSADKARALLELLEGAGLEHTNDIFRLDSDDEGSDDDDDVDYMEDDGTFLVGTGDDEPEPGEQENEIPPIKDGISSRLGEPSIIDYHSSEMIPHRKSGTVRGGILGAPTSMDEASDAAAPAANIEEEPKEWNAPTNMSKRKIKRGRRGGKSKAVKASEVGVADADADADVDRTPTKQEPKPSLTFTFHEDSPLRDDALLPEDTLFLEEFQAAGSPLDYGATTDSERLEPFAGSSPGDELTSLARSSENSREGKKQKGSEATSEDDLPYQVVSVIEAVYPVSASDPSRFEARPDYRSHRAGISRGTVRGRGGARGAPTMRGAARVPRGSFPPAGSNRYRYEEPQVLVERLRREKVPVAGSAPSWGSVIGSSAPPGQAKPRGVMGRLRLSALNLSKRLVEALETSDRYDDDGEFEDDLAFGDDHYMEKRRSTPGAREMPESPPEGPFNNFMVIPPADLPQPLPKRYPARRRKPPTLPGEFETLLRNKIFKPAVELTTPLAGPPWTSPHPSGTPPLFTKASLTWRDLRPLGQFVVERDRTLREDLKDVELGVGVGASGFNVDFNTKGILAVLKPVQWINLWRSYDKRRVHVSSHVLAPLAETKNVAPDKENEISLLMESTSNTEHLEEKEYRLLHEIEHELMSSVKYQFGQSPYITVITYSEGSSGGDRVDSGAVALFRASAFAPRSGGAQATKLDLEARFQDIPGPICRILAREKNPNRFEIKRNGSSLSVKERGKVAPPRPGIVRLVKKGAKAATELQGQGKEIEREWERIGGGWRRALHILLDHSDREAGGGDGEEEEEDDCPNEGLIATIPQMLALLHLRYRAVDFIPSTSVFTFPQPLRCDAMSAYVRRGVKLHGPPVGATHVGSTGTVAVLFSKESQWVREQLFWA